MKLDHLEVMGFGRLRGVEVAFHPRITLVAGPNESGKSTLHRAVRAALYGLDAGGQGRPVERSDWARWTPWTPGPYGIALIYTLDDGRRIRVSRALDAREDATQVVELGGGDISRDMRDGRTVAPGRIHLGVDEAVFCATAWLGDDGLRLGGAETASRRAEPLQEALERLADTAQGVTATEAIERLREALARVGTERRLSSPLGLATQHLRELENRLDEARRLARAVAGEQERLRELDARVAEAQALQLVAERGWLSGRLADIGTRRHQLAVAAEEAAQLEQVIAETQAAARFPLDVEERVTGLGAQLAQARLEAAEARARCNAGQDRLLTVHRRLDEIAATDDAAGEALQIDATTGAAVQRLHGELAATQEAVARQTAAEGVDARIAALRHEIAGTGLGSLPADSADALAGVMAKSRHRQSGGSWAIAAALVAGAGVAATVALVHQHAGPRAALVAMAALVAAAACGLRAALIRRRVLALQRGVEAAAAALGIDADDVDAVGGRLPLLNTLQAALLREQARREIHQQETVALHDRAAELAGRCVTLAHEAGLVRATPRAVAVSATAHLELAGEILGQLNQAAELQRRRAGWNAERARLADEQDAILALAEELRRRTAAVGTLEQHLQGALLRAGIPAQVTTTESVATVRQAAADRRRHDGAVTALEHVQARRAALGDDSSLSQVEQAFIGELRARGWDSALPAAVDAVDTAELQRLERQAEHSRQAAAAAERESQDVRSWLAARDEGAPRVADLEDDRHAQALERAQLLRQRAALLQAVELIDRASRTTHRDLAPRLARSVADRLSVLTGGRYRAVNVDTEHFEISLLGIERPDLVPLDVVSHGTRDQAALLLRLALCEVLSSSGERVPLLLDEPLLSADPHRRGLGFQFLHQLSETNQVVLTTSDPATIAALQEVAGDDCAVVHLGHDEPVIEATGRRLARVRVL